MRMPPLKCDLPEQDRLSDNWYSTSSGPWDLGITVLNFLQYLQHRRELYTLTCLSILLMLPMLFSHMSSPFSFSLQAHMASPDRFRKEQGEYILSHNLIFSTICVATLSIRNGPDDVRVSWLDLYLAVR